MSYDYLFRTILVGDSGVGKSQLLSRYTEDKFSETHEATIGVDFKVVTIKVGEESVKLAIWGTPGQERFRALCATYYKDAAAVLLVYDVTNQETFLSLGGWLAEVREENSEASIFLVGNKQDLAEQCKVSEDTARGWADANNVRFLGEVSAQSGSGVENAFERMAHVAVQEAPAREAAATKRLTTKGAAQASASRAADDNYADSASSPRASARWTVGRAVMALAGGVALGAGAAVLGMFALPMKVLIGAGLLTSLIGFAVYEAANRTYQYCGSSDKGLCHSALSSSACLCLPCCFKGEEPIVSPELESSLMSDFQG